MKRLLAAVFVLLSSLAALAQAQSLTASPSNLYASQTVTAAWSAIPTPTGTDWVGFYSVGAADTAPITWQYTDGNAAGSGPITVPNTTAAGSYELRLFAANGYTKLATSNGVTIDPPPPANLSGSPANRYASESVTAAWSSILAPTSTDWIGFYATGAADTAPITWVYASGTASGSVPVVILNATAPGSYELRLFANNGYVKLATSNIVTVDAPPPANLSASPANRYASQQVTATWSAILAPTNVDWIGFYATGAADNAPITWQYTTGSASGNIPFTIPNATSAGSYELRLFANNGYLKLATSNVVTVDPPPPATLSVSGSGAPGGSVTATWGAILAPTSTDWIGLYTPAAADNALIAWVYTTGTASGNVPLILPANLAPGNYELRLFANNGYTKLATSATFSVGTMKLSFIHPDHLNTPREVYDDQAQLRWKWDQAEPFGVTMPNEDPSSLGTFEMPLRFPGQYDDKETGKSNNYFRDYDSAIGRYVQSDPIGLRAGLNTYVYVNAVPSQYIDPAGLEGADTLFMPDDSPIVVAGRAFGGLAAYISGLVTGNQALVDASIQGMSEAKSANVESLILMASIGRGGSGGNACRVASNRSTLAFSKEKQALVEMARIDKRRGMTAADMQAYKDLNKGLPDPFPTNKVRGPEAHPAGSPISQQPHGHVGPVNHIPIIGP